MKVQILGCGTSTGVPRIGNDWGACDPENPRNARMRSSILVSLGGYHILVDTSPELRLQMLRARVGPVDAVIWTHEHADHCHGLDDLRQMAIMLRRPVLAYARQPVLDILAARFDYAFHGSSHYPPLVDAQPLQDRQRMGPLEVEALEMPHGPGQTSGLRFSDGVKTIGYATDFSDFTSDMVQFFTGVDLLVIDALRREPHPTHPHLAMSLDGVARSGARRAVLTHMDNSMDYDQLLDELPSHVEPGYDGMVIELG